MEHTYPTIDKTTSTPISVQIADHYREAIHTGHYRTDDPIPQTSDISTATGAGYGTANDAINALAAEGIITRKKKAGTFVRQRPRARTISADRYRHELVSRDCGHAPKSSAITRDLNIPWEKYQVIVTSAEIVESTSHQAELMRVETGTPLYRRATIDISDGSTPLQTGVSLMHPAHIEGSFFEDTSYTHRPGGTIEELRLLGLRPSTGSEWLRARDANDYETSALKLYRGATVYELTRRFLREDEVVEASQVVMPALGVTWRWPLDFQSWD